MDGEPHDTPERMEELDYEPAVLPPTEALSRARAVSTRILDMIDVRRGRATEPGPLVSRSEEDPDHLYRTLHFWSVYDAPEDELAAGFRRLMAALPQAGWTFVVPVSGVTAVVPPTFTADHETDRFAVNAELRLAGMTADPRVDTPLILLTVVSAWYRTPQNTAPTDPAG